MRITDIRVAAVPISSPISNAYIDFSKMDAAVVAIITDVVHDGEPVVGYGFNSNGRYAPIGLLNERFVPRLLEADPAALLDSTGENLDPEKIWTTLMTAEKPGGHGERSVAVGTIDMAIWDAVAKIEADRLMVTMGQLADDYFAAQIVGRWKHPNIVRARIENDIKPNIGKLPVADVKPQHIDAMLQTIVKRGAPTMANDVLRWVKRMFDYAIKRQMVTFNPATAFSLIDAGGKEASRERWLTRPELVKLFEVMRTAKGWNIENTYAVKLLLLLAVRREELIAAPLAEFDLDGAVWHLPAGRTKTGKAIDIPLPRQAVAILRELERLGGGSSWLLPARKMQSRMIPHIDLNTVGASLAKNIRPMLKDVAPFTVHDFRRTARTHLAALGVAPHVGERCLNHAVKGVEGIYMRHDFYEERKEALQKWADLLDQLERGDLGDNVVPLPGRKLA